MSPSLLIGSSLLAAALAMAAAAQDGGPIGGMGLKPCAAILGARNTPLLAQAGDWALGYMAGRLDAGQIPGDGEALSTGSSVDMITALVLQCRATPDAAVADAMRDLAMDIFGAEAAGPAIAAIPVAEAQAPPDAPLRTSTPPPPRPGPFGIAGPPSVSGPGAAAFEWWRR